MPTLFLIPLIFQLSLQPAQVLHLETQTPYAKLTIQAIGDQTLIHKHLDNLPQWIEQFTSTYSYDGKLDSLLYHAKAGSRFHLDTLSTQLLQFGLDSYQRTSGDIDVGIGNLLKAWQIGWNQHSAVPDSSTLKRLVEELKTFPYTIDSSRTLTVLREQRHIAMGSYLEGQILLEIKKRLEQANSKNFLVDYGSDFTFSGSKEGTPWKLGIKRPDHPDSLLAVVEINSKRFSGLSTSGSYEQTFTDSTGKRHHHIFDPKTGQSSEGNLSITVLSDNPLLNDMLDTWFMMLSVKQIKNVIEEYKGRVEAIVITDKNDVWISQGLQNEVTLLPSPYHRIHE